MCAVVGLPLPPDLLTQQARQTRVSVLMLLMMLSVCHRHRSVWRSVDPRLTASLIAFYVCQSVPLKWAISGS